MKVKEDIEFLKELKDRIEKGASDRTQLEYAITMVEDWIYELEEK